MLWPKGRQDARFSALIEPALSLDGERLTLCDFGCGLAHMQQYLEQHAIDKFLYSGYDIVPQMVEKSQELGRNVKLIEYNQRLEHVYDCTVASGFSTLGFLRGMLRIKNTYSSASRC